MDLKHLGHVAYKYFWKELKKLHFYDLSETDFLRGGIVVQNTVHDSYQFEKQQENTTDFMWGIKLFLKKSDLLLVTINKSLHQIKVDEDNLIQSSPLISIKDAKTLCVKALILSAYKKSSYIVWSSELRPFKSKNLWNALKSFKEIEWLEHELSEKSLSSKRWVQFLFEEDFYPSEEMLPLLKTFNGASFISVGRGAFYFQTDGLDLKILKEIDKEFSHFGYEVFIPGKFLLKSQDGWYKTFINQEAT